MCDVRTQTEIKLTQKQKEYSIEEYCKVTLCFSVIAGAVFGSTDATFSE